MNRLQTLYRDKIRAKLKKDLQLENEMQVPQVTKIVINMGIGDTIKDKQAQAKVFSYMEQICGQKPQAKPAKKSIAEFSIRQGDTVGVCATLRGQRKYEFLDKLISVVLPRVRDFQGVNKNSFDARGNYTLGVKEQIIFPEVNYDKIDKIRSLQVTICTTATSPKEAQMLLKEMGMPFAKENQ
jgi:large subunit ribosomal protein L5